MLAPEEVIELKQQLLEQINHLPPEQQEAATVPVSYG